MAPMPMLMSAALMYSVCEQAVNTLIMDDVEALTSLITPAIANTASADACQKVRKTVVRVRVSRARMLVTYRRL